MLSRERVDRLIAGVELAAGTFLAIVTAITFVSVVLRYAFSWSIPDGFDVGRLLLGIIIFWGIALAGYRGDHIAVDLLWGALGRRAQWALDLFAGFLTLGAMAVFAWMLGEKVLTTASDNVCTLDLGLPIWVFYLFAWIGILCAVALL